MVDFRLYNIKTLDSLTPVLDEYQEDFSTIHIDSGGLESLANWIQISVPAIEEGELPKKIFFKIYDSPGIWGQERYSSATSEQKSKLVSFLPSFVGLTWISKEQEEKEQRIKYNGKTLREMLDSLSKK